MPSPADRPVRVRLSKPADLAAVVPHLVGFHPKESLVVVSLRGPRLRTGLTMRWDLLPSVHDVQLAEHIAVRLAHDGAERAFVAVCTSVAGDPPDLPRRELVEELDRALTRTDLSVKEALLLREGRFWSYLCEDPTCCPRQGTPIPTDGAAVDIAAAHALNGRCVLPDREALAATIEPVRFLHREAMRQAVERAESAVEERLVQGEVAGVRSETVTVFGLLLDRYADAATATVSDDEAARVIVGLHDLKARDALFPLILDSDDDHLLALLTELCRRALPPYDAPVCTVLGWVAYSVGNGALASIAFERALTTDPAYSFARLLLDALHGQAPPSMLRQAALQSVARDGIGQLS